MPRSLLLPAFTFAAVTACASRPNPPPPAPAFTPSPAPASPAAATPSAAATSAPPVAGGADDPTTPVPEPSEPTPGVQHGTLAVQGELHPTRIKATVSSANSAIRACYVEALEKGTVGDKPVRVYLNFEITASGTITKLTDDTANINPLFSSCILRAIVGLRFTPPKHGVVKVTYPLELTKP